MLERVETLLGAGQGQAAWTMLDAGESDPVALARLRDWALVEREQALLEACLARLQPMAHAEAGVVRALRCLQQGDAVASRSILGALSPTEFSVQCSVAHHMGRALHNLGEPASALTWLAKAAAAAAHGGDPSPLFSLAHALRAGGRHEDAIARYRDYLELRPASRVARLELGITLCAADRAGEGLAEFDGLLAARPGDQDARLNRGVALHVLGRLEDAAEALEQVVRVDSRLATAHFHLGCVYNEQHRTQDARHALESALHLDPNDPDARAELVGLLEQNSELEAAAAQVGIGLRDAPWHPMLRIESARLARRGRRYDEAGKILAGIDPAGLPERQALQFWSERAALADRAGHPHAAMQALARVHRMEASNPRRRAVDRTVYPKRLQQIERWLDAGAPGGRVQDGDPPATPAHDLAFLVGFPRSGTTLLDTVIDAHRGVASIEEQPTLEVVSENLAQGRAYPWGMSDMIGDDVARARRTYEAEVGKYIADGTRLVLDKLPLRLVRAPLMHRLYPQAPILFMVRHPCDVVLSNYMQQYRPNEAFVHFDSIQASAAIYSRIMALWQRIQEQLDLPVHLVRYENLVESPDEELTRAFSALDIEYDPSMLDPTRRLASRGRVQTNSYQQVSEPIYRSASGRWLRYRQWLEPVLPVLLPHIRAFGYESPSDPQGRGDGNDAEQQHAEP